MRSLVSPRDVTAASRCSTPDAAERIGLLEQEQLALRQELAVLLERQDFTERALVREPQRPVAGEPRALPGATHGSSTR